MARSLTPSDIHPYWGDGGVLSLPMRHEGVGRTEVLHKMLAPRHRGIEAGPRATGRLCEEVVMVVHADISAHTDYSYAGFVAYVRERGAE